MANRVHLDLLKQGTADWNRWRMKNPEILPNLREAFFFLADLVGADLSRANLSGAHLILADLSEADLSGANLVGADLVGANLVKADLSKADLSKTNLSEANLEKANLVRADLVGADLFGTNLSEANLSKVNLAVADLSRANLSGADLSRANLSGAYLRRAKLIGANLIRADLRNVLLIETNLNKANLTGCEIYGISVWGLKLRNAKQEDLIITPSNEPIITVDNIEVAQFIYLLLNNEKIRNVIDTITSKVVLILGRFTPKRKAVLDVIKKELRYHNYLPVLVDFDKPANRDLTETVSILAHLARFVIADITNAKSVPQELERIVPDLPSVPVQPLLQASTCEYSMFEHFKRYPWVLDIQRYKNLNDLLKSLKRIISSMEAKTIELKRSNT